MLAAPVDAAFQALLKAKLEADYPGLTMRFRTSTNTEDLDGFPCAGCYDSHTGDPGELGHRRRRPATPTATRTAACCRPSARPGRRSGSFRTFEEREYHSIDHTSVGMALLVHHNFPARRGQRRRGDREPVRSVGPGARLLHQRAVGRRAPRWCIRRPGSPATSSSTSSPIPGQPIIFISHSNLIPDGTTVLTRAQTYELGTALDLIHQRFSPGVRAARREQRLVRAWTSSSSSTTRILPERRLSWW